MEPEYRLENGLYAFYLCGARKFVTSEVAILFDRDCSVLLKHGEPERVRAEFKRMHLAFGSHPDGADAANSLTLICGEFDLEELNKVLGICDYIGRLYAKLELAAKTQAAKVIEEVSH